MAVGQMRPGKSAVASGSPGASAGTLNAIFLLQSFLHLV